jgi:hypothetical protein
MINSRARNGGIVPDRSLSAQAFPEVTVVDKLSDVERSAGSGNAEIVSQKPGKFFRHG